MLRGFFGFLSLEFQSNLTAGTAFQMLQLPLREIIGTGRSVTDHAEASAEHRGPASPLLATYPSNSMFNFRKTFHLTISYEYSYLGDCAKTPSSGENGTDKAKTV